MINDIELEIIIISVEVWRKVKALIWREPLRIEERGCDKKAFNAVRVNNETGGEIDIFLFLKECK